MTPSAEVTFDKWYTTERPKPEDEALVPAWKREKVMLLKFAMIYMLAEGGPLVIRQHCVKRAITMVNSIRQFGKKIITAASATKETREIDVVGKWIKQKGQIRHSDLTRALTSSETLFKS